MRKMNLRRLLASGAAAGALSLAFGAYAQAEQATFTFNQPSMPMPAALQSIGRETGVNILVDSSLIKGLRANELKGELSADAALVALLDGTGLTVRKTDQNSVMIVKAAQDPQSGSAAGDGAEVEALIVTAQKREEDIQDVPIAISAFTQEQLDRSQVAGGPDLMTQVPNMTFTKTNFTGYSIQLRGIGTQAISATTDPAVAVAFNNTPFVRNRFFEQEFYDLQRVEVLRGPQGTLYGRNATAGVVNLISNKPKLDTYEARLSADVANYSSTRFEGMMNIPLANEVAALRVAGAWTKREGYAFNEVTGTPIDGRDLWSTRVSLRFAPTDAVDVNLIWEHFEEDDDRIRSGKQLCKRHLPAAIGGRTVPYGTNAPGHNNGTLYETYFSQGCEAASLYSPDSFQAPVGLRLPYYRPLGGHALPVVNSNPDGTPFDPYASTSQSRDLRVIESTVDPEYRAKTDLVELQASFDLTENITLTSETSYLGDFVFSLQDYNRFSTQPGAFSTVGSSNQAAIAAGVMTPDGYFCDPQVGCANRVVAVDVSTAQSRHFSQEFRIGSDYDGAFNFSLGANFLRYDTEEKYYVFINTLSLSAAFRANSWTNVPNYVPNVSDNSQCLARGFRAPDVNGVEDISECVYIDPNPIGSLNDLGHNYFLSKNPYKLMSYAVFGEAYYNFTDALKLTAGLRWTVDKKEAPRIPSWTFAANTVGYPVAEIVEQEWNEPTGRLALDWKPDLAFTDDTLLYASYAHGYKAGGANPPAAGLVMRGSGGANFQLLAKQQAAIAPRTFEAEYVDAFELGAKNTVLDGAATLNLAAFYYDYTGYQISQIVNRAAINYNFDAEVWGLEIEADWRPLENLRLGFKGGYEQTRMADGSRAIDTIDRTAGNADWYVTGPFPTFPSNCVLPVYTVFRADGSVGVMGGPSGGHLGPCELAYVQGFDPMTAERYVPYPTPSDIYFDAGYYPGFDPLAGTPGNAYTGQNTFDGVDYGIAPNGGAGFFKDLSGNELPNAPKFTATLTADYTVPLPSDWLATLHTDLYYQSEAWTRIYNTEGYDKLKAYTNVNVAAIFTQEDLGWKVMAYVKNVFDRDSITGAFLNSDDTGLTTNVFLTEPRLYGLRVTKEWTGGPWWTGANLDHKGPFPLTVELGGQVQRHEAPYETLAPESFAALRPALNTVEQVQHRDLDWGDGRSVEVTWRPAGSHWSVSAEFRQGEANNETARVHAEEAYQIVGVCGYTNFLAQGCNPVSPIYFPQFSIFSARSWSDTASRTDERHTVAEFAVGYGLDVLDLLDTSRISLGARRAELESKTSLTGMARDNWSVLPGWNHTDNQFATDYASQAIAERSFEGFGPTATFDMAKTLWGGPDSGRLDIEASLTGGVLFGDQETVAEGSLFSQQGRGRVTSDGGNLPFILLVGEPSISDETMSRTDEVSVPLADLSVGFSFAVGRAKVSTGYRWERYFDVLDTGYDEGNTEDRTIDGPYFRLGIGFGG